MVSNSFPVFMLITHQGRGREFRWQDLRSIFLIPMNSSQPGTPLAKSLYCMYYHILGSFTVAGVHLQKPPCFQASFPQDDSSQFLIQSARCSYFHCCPLYRTNLTILHFTTLAEISQSNKTHISNTIRCL